jgi:hypothetical protein
MQQHRGLVLLHEYVPRNRRFLFPSVSTTLQRDKSVFDGMIRLRCATARQGKACSRIPSISRLKNLSRTRTESDSVSMNICVDLWPGPTTISKEKMVLAGRWFHLYPLDFSG